MSGDVHVRFRERLGGKFPGATRLVVTGVSREVLEQRVLPAIKQFLALRGLELSDEKTKVVHVTEGFDFLGQNVRKYGGKLLIKPARKSEQSLVAKVREIVVKNWSATQENLILQLNPVIRGWGMYHRHAVSKSRFTAIDAHIWRLLWKWAVRRHPTKGMGWVRRRYFRTEGNRTWVFAAEIEVDGHVLRLRLFRAATIPIVRHVKIRGMANAFDPRWSSYFARRRAVDVSD